MSIRTRVGFVGLGNIGKPMALQLAAAENIDLRVFDLAPEPVDESSPPVGRPPVRSASWATGPT